MEYIPGPRICNHGNCGRRTVLDVLNAEQELLNARVAHVCAKHARISAFFAVLSAMGELSPENLGLEIYKK